MSLSIVILAAGMGTRMRSAMPKVLHEIGGRSLLGHVIHTASSLHPTAIHVVYGHGGEQVRATLAAAPVNWVEQAEQKGTGHAVMQALPAIADDHQVLVLYGDVPLITATTLQSLVDRSRSSLAILTAEFPDPQGYGRIVRNGQGSVRRIVEQKDASAEEQQIREINTGFLCAPARLLRNMLNQCTNDNAQGEYYLTDVVEHTVADGGQVDTVTTADLPEVAGVNDRVQLAALERELQRRHAERLMRNGVTLRDPSRFDLRGDLDSGRDVVIDINVVIEGKVSLGDGVEIGPNCVLRDVRIAAGTRIAANCVLEEAEVGENCRIGPFARLRPGAQLSRAVRVGNFVEIKKSTLAEGAKVNHLTYIGDAEIGREVNIGAGTITCNYDGVNKHRTVIGDGAFIGSNTELVAPVTVGAGATIGAGTTLTGNVEPGALAVTRAPQRTIPNWRKPKKR